MVLLRRRCSLCAAAGYAPRARGVSGACGFEEGVVAGAGDVVGACGDEGGERVVVDRAVVPGVDAHVDLTALLAPRVVDVTAKQPVAAVDGVPLRVLGRLAGGMIQVGEVVEAHRLAGEADRGRLVDDPSRSRRPGTGRCA